MHPIGILTGISPSPNERHRSYRMPSTSPACSEAYWCAEIERYFEYLIKNFPGDKEKFVAAKQMLLANDFDLKLYKDFNCDALE